MTAPSPHPNGNSDADGSILHNLMLFGEVLRRLGLDFGSGNMLDLVRATEDVPLGRKQDFRQAARSLLVHRKQDLPLFDEAFQVFWRRPGHRRDHPGPALDGGAAAIPQPPGSPAAGRRLRRRGQPGQQR